MRIAVLLTALLAAGCSSPPEGEPAEPSTSTAPTASASSVPAPPPAPATPWDIPYSFSGRTWTTACAFAQTVGGHCQHVAEGSNLTEPLPDEPVVRVRGTLTWSDGNEEVGIGLVWEEGGEIQFDPAFYAEGTSPLSFDWEVPHLADKDLAYHVASYVSAGAPEAHVDASPGQDWQLEAVLTVLEAAATAVSTS